MEGAGPPEIGAELIWKALDSLADPHMLLRPVRNMDGEVIDFQCVMANRAACARWQMTREQLVGSHLLDLQPGPAGRRIFDTHNRVLETGEPLVLDRCDRTGGGEQGSGGHGPAVAACRGLRSRAPCGHRLRGPLPRGEPCLRIAAGA